MHSSRPSNSRSSTMDSVPTLPSRGSVRTVKLFDGSKRATRAWDGLRRDAELWVETGDCMVHLYAPGTSRRGASFKIPLELLEQTNSRHLLRECLYRPVKTAPSTASSEDDGSDSGYGASVSGDSTTRCCELYLSAPMELTRAEAFSYHIGTRNYFAYLLRKPIVGEDFGVALAHLWKRIEVWQPQSSASEVFQKYCEEQGYLNLAGNLDYASAALYWSELARVPSVWIEAFVHCVGMDGQLKHDDTSRLSVTTRAMIKKASQDMHVHVSKATRSLGTFLEQELGSEKVGLTKPLRDHLDRFRSVLHSYYVNEVGYFPPGPSEPWDKRLWTRMYDDFRSLYKYLADTKSSTDLASGLGMGGGMCVSQNIRAFDQSKSFSPLPHPLPLLPEHAARTARMSLSHMRKSRTTLEQEALEMASNSDNCRVMANQFVQAYIQFERQSLQEKITPVEARKVRWLLVYGVLQMLISVTKAPQEVRDTETPSYPLCVSTEGCPPWVTDENLVAELKEAAQRLSPGLVTPDETASIRPDCDAQTAGDYFSSGYYSSRGSKTDLTRPVSRSASIRSSVGSLHKSMVGSFVRRNSKTRSLSEAPELGSRRPSSSFQQIVIERYGNGAESASTYPQIHHLNTALPPNATSYFTENSPATAHSTASSWSDRDNRSSTVSSFSSRSPIPESPGTEVSFREEDISQKSAPACDFAAFEFGFTNQPPVRSSKRPSIAPARTLTTTTHDELNEETFEDECVLAAEIPLPLTPFGSARKAARRSESPSSITSSSSSLYPEDSMQAAEIEETDVRGRRRMRGMDRLRWIGATA